MSKKSRRKARNRRSVQHGRAPAQPSRSVRTRRSPLVLAGATLLALLAVGGVVLAGGRESDPPAVQASDPGPVHVHGLGINPRDGALFIATHAGTYRVPPAGEKAERVGDRMQDTMGFTVVGPDRFLGSGHPDVRDVHLPPLLGLVESRDAGRRWKPISMPGEADFHVLRSVGERIYGFDVANGRLLVSGDGGKTWSPRRLPAPLVDLAPHPTRRGLLIAAGENGLFRTRDDARSWTRVAPRVGFLAWPTAARLYLVDGEGSVHRSSDAGRRWTLRGNVGGEPAAVTASGSDVYVALHDGTVKSSSDGGATWTVRSTP